MCLEQLAWLGVVVAWAGASDWPRAVLATVGFGVAVAVLVGGLRVARRFRR